MVKTNLRNHFTAEQINWLQALKSNKYKQLTECLHIIHETKEGEKEEGFCCLGVCCLLAKDDINLKVIEPDEYNGSVKYGKNGEADTLPREVQLFYCLYSDNGGFVEGNQIFFKTDKHYEEARVCLAGMNDNGITFTQIAKFIEQFPWIVFMNFDKPDDVNYPIKLEWHDGKQAWE